MLSLYMYISTAQHVGLELMTSTPTWCTHCVDCRWHFSCYSLLSLVVYSCALHRQDDTTFVRNRSTLSYVNWTSGRRMRQFDLVAWTSSVFSLRMSRSPGWRTYTRWRFQLGWSHNWRKTQDNSNSWSCSASFMITFTPDSLLNQNVIVVL